MTAGIRRAGLLLFGILAVVVVVWNLVPQTAVAPSADQSPAPFTSHVAAPTSGSGAGQPVASVPEQGAMREYSVALDELQGVPPDATPGTNLELWVTWDKPSGGAPRLHKLIAHAALARIVPPSTPVGPTAAVLSIPIRRVPDLMYADAYGKLSVTILP
jgi:hypothetical protein